MIDITNFLILVLLGVAGGGLTHLASKPARHTEQRKFQTFYRVHMEDLSAEARRARTPEYRQTIARERRYLRDLRDQVAAGKLTSDEAAGKYASVLRRQYDRLVGARERA